MFTDDDYGLFTAALAEPPDALTLTAAYDRLIERLVPLSPDGWLLHGGELVRILQGFWVRSACACDGAAQWIGDVHDDEGTPLDPSDPRVAETIEQAEGGKVFVTEDGGAYWLAPLLLGLLERRERVRQLESDAGLIVLGNDRYTTVR
jgi:hypothetical protein